MASAFSGGGGNVESASDTAKSSFKWGNPTIVAPTGEVVQQQGYIDPTTGQFVAGNVTKGAAPAIQQGETAAQKAAREQSEAIGLQMLGRGQELSSTLAGQPTSLLTNLPAAPSDQVTDPNAVRQAVYDQGLALLSPQFDLQSRRTTQGLADRGLPMNGEAYRGEQDRLAQTQNNALVNLANTAVTAGADQQARNFQNQMTLRSTALGEAQTDQNQILNQIAALLGGNAQFNTTLPQYQGVDYSSLSANAANQQAQQAANQNGMLGGLFQLGGTLGSAAILSDRRLKTDIRRIGTTDGGLPVYLFKYRHDPEQITRMGVMAQDVAEVAPEAVHEIGGGYLAVDYGALQ